MAPRGFSGPVVLRSGSPAALRLSGADLRVVATARVYTCGITPYDVTHLGHAATFVWADLLASVWRLCDVETVTCRNVTDVDDVLTRAARLRGGDVAQFALEQEYAFDRGMSALRVRRPAYEPRARHFVGAVQQLAAALLAAGRAYVREGFVYFRGTGVVDRCGLSREAALTLSAEFGDDPHDERRDDPFDVAVWRPSGNGEPAWPSPWGPGRPGWHAECAAMALSVLGPSVDVLAGGVDLAFPHHAYQAAMVEAVTSVTPFARVGLHVGEVRQDGAKMAKSTGNLTLVTDLLREHSPAAVRLLLLDRPWHTAWDYDPGDLDRAAGRVEMLYAAAGRSGGAENPATGAVTTALLDDLDVSRAIEVALDGGGAAARLLLRTLALT
ncbi:cysteine--1-D-myo-inosityl 2-amino-2-deoxy-alpha-D-glucopyranoside ligase [Actinoplanes sp. KI2]|uniref:cysteine--1-D-myo-inosityl 2-amino-2-deoxy-alpha-D-glucopyranoside ligase n=1 Tax=Actinoplanes sp. KI2 TaxID=2983315 RepID=UPI0021D5D1E2|nr:cysteine--1-D-myo-inosityl 2-amino-2-deoxy-alpha-D-glucopyranoside ligase [Actinoplanes sp. KI2]MCU7731198.1 cysteine--1-D-myo-inosityl 2-amino-2-deoxy-alpha-D-glucopyranoside ligase [Actinoplanes sp. KI2]